MDLNITATCCKVLSSTAVWTRQGTRQDAGKHLERRARQHDPPLLSRGARAGVELTSQPGQEVRTEYWSFPTVEQLQTATEAELRTAGFGYRARYIVGSAALLAAQPGGT